MRMDKTTVELIKRGDVKTIEYLYSSYYKLVKYHVYEIVRNNEDAEELTQDVFVKVFYKIGQYDEKHSFATWLINIAKHTAIDHLRKRSPNIDYVEEILPRDQEDAELIGGSLDEKIRGLLSEEEYKIVTSRVYFDLKFIEVAKMLGISLASVTRKYYKGIRKLKKELKMEDFYD